MRNDDIKSNQTFDISTIHKEFQTIKKVTTTLVKLIKILTRYEFKKLEMNLLKK